MRTRRDPFARVSYIPKYVTQEECAWCGRSNTPCPGNLCEKIHGRVWSIRGVHDDGKEYRTMNTFCSWSCAEAYYGYRIGR